MLVTVSETMQRAAGTGLTASPERMKAIDPHQYY